MVHKTFGLFDTFTWSKYLTGLEILNIVVAMEIVLFITIWARNGLLLTALLALVLPLAFLASEYMGIHNKNYGLVTFTAVIRSLSVVPLFGGLIACCVVGVD